MIIIQILINGNFGHIKDYLKKKMVVQNIEKLQKLQNKLQNNLKIQKNSFIL